MITWKRSRRAPRTALTGLLALLVLAAAGCSGKTTDNEGGSGADGVKVGEGVTDRTIALGALTDMTGAYASLGKSVTQAQQLYVKQLNADGGICDREIKLVVRDHGYDAGKAIPAYTELRSKVLGFPQFLGSPLVSAVKQRIDQQDKALVIPMAWSSELLGSDHIRMIGATYDVETINAIDFLMKEKGIARGDRIGHVYFEGDYGENALRGAQHIARQAGLTIVQQKIKPTDEDMSAQVSAFKKAKVDAVVLSGGPRQAASLVGVAAATGLNVPIIGNNSAYAPQLLRTQAGPALTKNYHVAASILPIGSTEPGPTALATAYQEAYPQDVLDNGVIAGHLAMKVFGEVLKRACKNKDLTRAGVTKALLSLDRFDSAFGIAHDFSDSSLPSTRQSFILAPDADAPGGMVVHRQARASAVAEKLDFPS